MQAQYQFFRGAGWHDFRAIPRIESRVLGQGDALEWNGCPVWRQLCGLKGLRECALWNKKCQEL